MTTQLVTVDLGDRSYPVIVGPGAINELSDRLPSTAKRAVVVTQEGLPSISIPHLDVTTVLIERGENSKNLATIERLCRSFAAAGITRNDVIIGVGGGMVTDVAGYAASSWHRGTPVVHVATSLLAMVDASIGGKTGVNIPEGKNLVGAFWQPRAVICDTDHLSTLPDVEMRCGLGEVAKYHFISGTDFLALPLVERIAECVRVKASIVSQDEREGGLRALLNYGHTLGHALESAGGHALAHGEAVAIGVVFAAHLSRDLGLIDEARVELHERIVGQEYGLLVRPPSGQRTANLIEFMKRDKKAVEGLTFVLDGSGGLRVVPNVPEAVVSSALDRFLA